jgi:FAD/FMN-containing dehydrogenase
VRITRRSFLRILGATALWPGASVRIRSASAAAPGVTVNDLHSQLNETVVASVATPQTKADLLAAFGDARRQKFPVCIAGGRHAMGGQAFATGGALVDMRGLDDVLELDSGRGLVRVQAGIQWPRLLEQLHALQKGRAKQWAFAQKQTGADRLTIGGCLAANVHGRGLSMPPFIADVESFELLDARGELVECSRTQNSELFRLVIGGYGLFGIVCSATLRLVPRRKLERVVEVRTVEGLPDAFAGRVREGFLYGDFQYAIDEKSDDFLRRGVFSCYRPVDDKRAVPEAQKELAETEWVELLYLTHGNKSEAFRRYADYYLSTSGQVYWSDDSQMSIYPDDYHRGIDSRQKSKHRATEGITEIYCERDRLEEFLAAVRDYARRDGLDIIYGTVRLIEQDRESFLAWAKKPYACTIFNLHIEHTPEGLARARDQFRGLIDIGIRHGGSYFPTYHKHATRKQVEACFPQFAEFLRLKRKYDPDEVFQSDWYRHYRAMFA